MSAGNWKGHGFSISIEVAPWFYAGGLGVAVREMADALNRNGHRIDVVVPYLFKDKADGGEFEKVYLGDFSLEYTNPLHGVQKPCKCDVYKHTKEISGASTTIYAIHDPEGQMCNVLERHYRAYHHDGDGKCEEGKPMCFVCALLAFNQVAAELIVRLNEQMSDNGFQAVNLVVAHDWLTAGTLSVLHERHPEFYHVSHKLFFVHNKYNKAIPAEQATKALGFKSGYLKQEDNLSLLADGIHLSDVVIGNPGFLDSIGSTGEEKKGQDKEEGEDPVAKALQIKKQLHRQSEVHHGVSELFSPQGSDVLSANGFVRLDDAVNLTKCGMPSEAELEAVDGFKSANRRALLEKYELGPDERAVVYCWVARFDYAQKGLSMVFDNMDSILGQSNHRLLMLGSVKEKDENLTNQLKEFRDKYGDRLYVDPKRREPFGREDVACVLAGSDFLLMPSVYEPFGLSHLEAMGMGCVPIVHPVHGIRCTVQDPEKRIMCTGGRNPEQIGQTAVCMDEFDSSRYEAVIPDYVADEKTKSPVIEQANNSFAGALARAQALPLDERLRVALNGMRHVEQGHRWDEIVKKYYDTALRNLHRVHRASMTMYVCGKPEARLLLDRHVEHGEVFFGGDEWASALASLALSKHNETPFTVVVDGEWGRGKTTFLTLTQQKLEHEGHGEQVRSGRSYRKVETLWFNAWKHPDEGSMLAGLVCTLLNKIAENEEASSQMDKVVDWFNGVAPHIMQEIGAYLLEQVPYVGSSLKEVLKQEVKKTNKKEDSQQVKILNERALYDGFEEVFASALKRLLGIDPRQSNDAVLAIFLDDLDRCSEKRVLDALETIKLFLDTKGVCFYLGVDFDRITWICGQQYGDRAGKFLEKFMQVHYRLPPISKKTFKEYVSRQLSPNLRDAIGGHEETIAGLPKMRNPRRLKLFLNHLGLRIAAAESSLSDIGALDVVQKTRLHTAIVEYELLRAGMESREWVAVTHSGSTLSAYIRGDVERLRESVRYADSETKQTISGFEGTMTASDLEPYRLSVLYDMEAEELQRLISGVVTDDLQRAD